MNKKYITLGVLAAITLIVGVIIGVVVNQEPPFTKLTLVNETALSSVPKDLVVSFRRGLYETLVETYQLRDDVEINDVEIRADTLSTDSQVHDPLTIYSADFIVDVPSFEQTYKVSLRWPDSDTAQNPISAPVIISCPSAEETKYPNTSCYINNLFGAN